MSQRDEGEVGDAGPRCLMGRKKDPGPKKGKSGVSGFTDER